MIHPKATLIDYERIAYEFAERRDWEGLTRWSARFHRTTQSALSITMRNGIVTTMIQLYKERERELSFSQVYAQRVEPALTSASTDACE